ncbi:MAG TPA: CTP synthase [Candidatus Paceibacterota bacterium]|nr:CTP synthase [Candidatus Paceibacterota bacterium]
MKKPSSPKYIFVVGGVISGVGKGITASSIAKILQDRGLTVTALKIDPYINIDAGTMNPTEHGEVFVLPDGDETDQDMGNYERFLDINLTSANYMTTGRVYQSVIEQERALKFGGACVQVVPHIPLEVIARIQNAQKHARADVVIVEIGGTVGEYENILFLEAARMLKIRHPRDVMFVMVSYLPTPSKIGEMKTKPTQHSVRTLNSSGLQADLIVARSHIALDEKRKQKLSFFCNVPVEHVISAPDIDTIYEVPMNFEKQKVPETIANILDLKLSKTVSPRAKEWATLVKKIKNGHEEVRIAVVGKYFDTGDFTLTDSYISVIEAIKFSAFSQNRKPKLEWISSEQFEKPVRPNGRSGGDPKSVKLLAEYDGVLVPGGFGSRGVEGKIAAIKFARENKIPYFGLCYGMQLAVVEYARHMAGIKGATTREINPKSTECVIDVMDSQREKLKKEHYGGSMRLGSYEALIKPKTLARELYNDATISERHRHRFEVNPEFIPALEKAGLVFSGTSPDGTLMEIAELPTSKHPFFLGTQFHPEFQARPLSPHPLFTGFIKAAIKYGKSRKR